MAPPRNARCCTQKIPEYSALHGIVLWHTPPDLGYFRAVGLSKHDDGPEEARSLTYLVFTRVACMAHHMTRLHDSTPLARSKPQLELHVSRWPFRRRKAVADRAFFTSPYELGQLSPVSRFTNARTACRRPPAHAASMREPRLLTLRSVGSTTTIQTRMLLACVSEEGSRALLRCAAYPRSGYRACVVGRMRGRWRKCGTDPASRIRIGSLALRQCRCRRWGIWILSRGSCYRWLKRGRARCGFGRVDVASKCGCEARSGVMPISLTWYMCTVVGALPA